MSWDRALGLDGPTPEPAAPPAPRISGTSTSRFASNSPGARARRRRRREAAQTKRLDIQGLRAVAVLAVVVNHLFDKPIGGFVGVDVFFVISGFLITGHLVREHDAHGRISLTDFYRRRVRRLFPAALTVIVATVIAAWLIFGSGQRLTRTVLDATFATVFSANWRFIHTGTDYFLAGGPVSPLQHYWSLSVEEQFYVVWPVVLIAALALARRVAPGRRQLTVVAGGIAGALLTVASLVYAVHETAASPVVAYFSTFTRGWELGLGALLAVLVPYMRGSRAVLSALSWLGTAIVIASFFFVTPVHFPFPGALVPCAGSALVIVAATAQVTAANPLLTNGLATYVGDISYSVYVVHFPVIVFSQALVTGRSVWFYVATLAICFGLSSLLFTLVENPVRDSRWLRPRRERGDNVLASRRRGPGVVIGAGLAVLGLAAYVVAAPPSSTSTQYQQILAAQARAAASPSPGSTAATPTLGPLAQQLSGQIAAALRVTDWPALNPSFDNPTANPDRGCSSTLKSAATCTWGNADAPHTLYLVGDSTSAAFIPTFAGVVSANPTWKMRAAGGSGCPFGDKILNDADGNRATAGCLQRNQAVVDEINAVKPDLVIVTHARSDAAYTSSVGNELAKIKGSVNKIVMLPAPPQGKDPNACKTTISKPADCASPVSSDYRSWVANEKKMAADLGGTLIDTESWFCAAGYCTVFAGTTPMKKDPRHLTPEYATMLGPVANEAFTAARLLTAVA